MKRAAAYLILAASMWALAATAVKPRETRPPASIPGPGLRITPTDPALCYNAEQKKWLMFYTQRRGNGDQPDPWHAHRCGRVRRRRRHLDLPRLGAIDYGADKYPDGYTYWAPDVIWFKGIYHMYLTFRAGHLH